MDENEGAVGTAQGEQQASGAQPAQGTGAPAQNAGANDAADDQAGGAGAGEGQAVEPELEEVEVGGQRYSVPKALKPALMLNADYTRKTQALADERRQAEEAVRVQVAHLQRQHQAVSQQRELVGLELQLENYAAITPEQWQQFSQAAPEQANAEFIKFQALREKVHGLRGAVAQEEQRRAFETQQSLAKRIEQADAIYKRDIPGWSPAKADELANFAIKELGAAPQDLRGVIAVPWLVKALAKAHAQNQLISQAKAQPSATEAKPVRAIAASGTRSTVDPDKLSMSDWMKWQDAEDRKKRRA